MPHNEYLQYLVIIGISGLVTYVGFLAASGWRMAAGSNKNEYSTVFLAVKHSFPRRVLLEAFP